MDASQRGRSRRSVLAGAAALGGVLAGCTINDRSDAPDVTGASSGSTTAGSASVSLLAAGSLNNAFENGLRAETDVDLRVEAHGSAAITRLIAAGQRDPDIVSVADVALFDGPLSPPWYAEFATNSIVLAYNRNTEGGRRVGEAGSENWYEPLVAGTVALGRTDPDLDPLGYRTLFTLELASRYSTERLPSGGESRNAIRYTPRPNS